MGETSFGGTAATPSGDWRSVVGYEGLYGVTPDGRVIDLRRGVFRAPVPDTCGYLTVRLTKDGSERRCSVHRLVCAAYHGPAPEKHQCAHLDATKRTTLPAICSGQPAPRTTLTSVSTARGKPASAMVEPSSATVRSQRFAPYLAAGSQR